MKSLKRIKLIQKNHNEQDLKKSCKILKLIVKNKDDVGAVDGLSPRFGLCTNSNLINLPKPYLKSLFKSWEHFSGDFEYPVKSLVVELSHGSYYRLVDDKFAGSYGETRIELAKHLIKKMKKDIKNLAESD